MDGAVDLTPWDLDEDPDACLAVIKGEHKGSKAYAAICLARAIENGRFPAGWEDWR